MQKTIFTRGSPLKQMELSVYIIRGIWGKASIGRHLITLHLQREEVPFDLEFIGSIQNTSRIY